MLSEKKRIERGMQMDILLIRHGLTSGNLQRRYVGRTDEPLCSLGIEQLHRQFDVYLKRFPVLKIQDAVYFIISPMRRCIQTAELLAEQMKIESPYIKKDPDLREIDFGDFEYKNYEELHKNQDYQHYINTNGAGGFPGAEPLWMFKKRCVHAFAEQIQWLEAQHAKLAVFVVHGGTIMAVMEHFVCPRQDYFSWQVKNGCGYHIEGGRDKCRVLQHITYLE